MTTIVNTPMREALAAYAHEAWSGWTAYLLDRAQHNPDGSVTLSAEWVAGLQRQVTTPYADLTEPEKGLDRVEADHMLRLVASATRESAV